MYVNGLESVGDSAELDLAENFFWTIRPHPYNRIYSQFSNCDRADCVSSRWSTSATQVHHHITVSTIGSGDHKTIRLQRCANPRNKNLTTCNNGEYAEIKVGPWYPVWNRDKAGVRYGMYWLVSDIWQTDGTSFQLTVDNVRFYKEDGSEWKMALNGEPPDFGVGRGQSEVLA